MWYLVVVPVLVFAVVVGEVFFFASLLGFVFGGVFYLTVFDFNNIETSGKLVGEDLNAWQNWREVLLCTPSEHAAIVQQEGEVTPFTDPLLVQSQSRYAKFIGALAASNCILCTARSSTPSGSSS